MLFKHFSFSAFIILLLIIGLPSAYFTRVNQPEARIQQIEIPLNAHIGVTIYDTETEKLWSYKGDERIPLTSTFKTLACAKLLHDVDTGKASLTRATKVNKDTLVTYSPVMEQYIGKEVTASDACSATLRTSDNTAANIVLEAIGGPKALTLFMHELGDNVTRLDRIEPHLNEARPGDIRDTTTPDAMVKTLNKLLFGNVLSEKSKAQLTEWMIANEVSDNLLRAVLPAGWKIADRSGAGGYGSRSITAVVWPDKRAPFIVAIYITQTDASFERRNQAIVDIGAAIFAAYARQKQ